MKSMIHPEDPYKMNWIEGTMEWGTVKCPKELSFEYVSKKEGEIITETFIFTNNTERDIFTSLRDVSIYTTFNDNYEDAKTCMTNRCHSHVWCGGHITYVCALRMGGMPHHLGLVLTKGSMEGYSIERDITLMSNDRGDILLHPSPMELAPGESCTIEWVLFWHTGKEDFNRQLAIHNPKYISVTAKDYVLFQGESIHIEISPAFDFSSGNVSVECSGYKAAFEIKNKIIIISDEAIQVGERTYNININGIETICRIIVLPKLSELARKRCYFIAENQQYHKKNSRLDGAFLIYDMEEKHCYYNPDNDKNGGRERIGMGILLAKYLQGTDDEFLSNSLLKYMDYIKRELVHEETGEVFNDYMRDNSYFRLYNYPWMSCFYIELYCLYHLDDYLKTAYKVLCSFYKQGGSKFYAIEVPVLKITECLEKAGMLEEKGHLIELFREHCSCIIEYGTNYPHHEVKYEQSIVAPAANILIQMYLVTKESLYLEEAKKQMKVLELFNGIQPDYHMYEVSIRHWDGYWFGKRKLYGDTFPHYWSSLTGNAYDAFAKALQDEGYQQKAHSSIRGSLSLFHPDGSASCAYMYPVSVNGIEAGYYDPYANDQDWGLYFMLRYNDRVD